MSPGVVNGISYDLHAGETVALVGESGSGKSVSSLALLGLVAQPPGRVSGEVVFGGRNLVAADREVLRSVRGNGMAMVFQDPMTSLNPVMPIGRQVGEGMQLHLGLSDDEAHRRALELLELVGIPAPSQRMHEFPHQLSGGMRQRVMIAMGLACRPQVLIADEPTTALDVTIQAQIIDLVARLQEELGMAVLWITHDLGVVAGIADRVLVMYAGRVVEEADVDELYRHPRHPYTAGLIGALPVLGAGGRGELTAIPGGPPDPAHLPAGCAFWPRCTQRLDDRCATEVPPLRPVGLAHHSACFYEESGPADRGDGGTAA